MPGAQAAAAEKAAAGQLLEGLGNVEVGLIAMVKNQTHEEVFLR